MKYMYVCARIKFPSIFLLGLRYERLMVDREFEFETMNDCEKEYG